MGPRSYFPAPERGVPLAWSQGARHLSGHNTAPGDAAMARASELASSSGQGLEGPLQGAGPQRPGHVAGAGHCGSVDLELQGLPAAPETGELQSRRGDDEDDGRPLRAELNVTKEIPRWQTRRSPTSS